MNAFRHEKRCGRMIYVRLDFELTDLQ